MTQSEIIIHTSALLGIPRIDDTTKQLANTLAGVKDVIEYAPGLSPQVYGTLVHTAFAVAVRAQGLPGIASSDVETTFGGDRYGSKGSIRTDVVLRNDVGDIIAIYDVKTGEKGLSEARLAEIRAKTDTDFRVPIFQLSIPYGVTRKSAGSVVVSRARSNIFNLDRR